MIENMIAGAILLLTAAALFWAVIELFVDVERR